MNEGCVTIQYFGAASLLFCTKSGATATFGFSNRESNGHRYHHRSNRRFRSNFRFHCDGRRLGFVGVHRRSVVNDHGGWILCSTADQFPIEGLFELAFGNQKVLPL